MKKPMLLLCIFVILLASCTTTSTVYAPAIREIEQIPEIEADIMVDVVVNIEGVITEVSKDGKSFRLNNGKWVITDKQTVLGISGPTAPPKNKQYFDSSFQKGNSIAGFSETPDGEIIVAEAIYTNWNWSK